MKLDYCGMQVDYPPEMSSSQSDRYELVDDMPAHKAIQQSCDQNAMKNALIGLCEYFAEYVNQDQEYDDYPPDEEIAEMIKLGWFDDELSEAAHNGYHCVWCDGKGQVIVEETKFEQNIYADCPRCQ